jgi:hypothetical protein
MAKAASKEIAIPAAELEMATLAIMTGEPVDFGGQDSEVISRAILERILQADSLEAALTPQTLTSWRDHQGRPCSVLGFRFNRSGFERGSSVYAVIDLVWHDTGEQETVSCGGRNVLMQLVRAATLSAVPFDCKLHGNRTGDGNTALWIVDKDYRAS